MPDADQPANGHGPDRAHGHGLGRTAVVAGVAGVLGGTPSTIHALLTGRDPLEALRAAGTVLAPATGGPRLLAAGAVVHATVSAGWTVVLTPVVRRSARPILAGALLGLVVAAVDVMIAKRRFPRLAALPRWPQIGDHVAYGALVGWGMREPGMLRRRPTSRSPRLEDGCGSAADDDHGGGGGAAGGVHVDGR